MRDKTGLQNEADLTITAALSQIEVKFVQVLATCQTLLQIKAEANLH